MRRRQSNIYSLLGQIGSELKDKVQGEENSCDGGRDLPERRMDGFAKRVVPEGPNRIELNNHIKGKERDLGDRTSSDVIEKVCPQCKKAGLVRVKRHRWMRLILRSQHYFCLECKAKFLVVGRFEIKLQKKKAGG
jgi:hypothetical protein